MGIRETISRIRTRLSDIVLTGRNKALIVIGTDRKNSKESGYGDGGQNDTDSAAIDIMVGHAADSTDPNMQEDKSRIYVAEKTDPDDYFGISVGDSVTGEPAIVHISDNLYMKARQKIKIVNENVSINIDQDGNIEIEAGSKAQIKVGNSKIVVSESGNIELDAGQEINGRIITHLDSCSGTDPVTGGEIISTFVKPTSVVNNNKVFVK